MLVPIYDINIGHKVQIGTLAVGVFDGIHPSLVGATVGNRIFVHSPFSRSGGVISQTSNRIESGGSKNPDVFLLNVKQPINAVATGRLNPTSRTDTVVVGTSSSLLAYNVERNADLFYQDLPDGVQAITIGKFHTYDQPLVIAGGNCTLQGFDVNGTEKFWTMTGDNVHSLAILDYDDDGFSELAVGSEDFEIRLFRGDALATELDETDVVTHLLSLGGRRLAYSLKNGILGMYDGITRAWRIKSKNPATCLLGYDANDDGVLELMIGWSNGKVECRSDSSPDGEPIFKETLNGTVAGLVKADYRNDGDVHVLAATVDGAVKAFTRKSTKMSDSMSAANAASAEASKMTLAIDQEEFRRLSSYKQRLLLELDSYTRNEAIEKKVAAGEAAPPVDSIPASTQLLVKIYVDPGRWQIKPEDVHGTRFIQGGSRPGSGTSGAGRDRDGLDNEPCVKLSAIVNTEAIEIRALAVFAEGVFEGGESEVLHPLTNRPTGTQLSLPINPIRNIAAELHVKAIVGQRHANVFHVLETSIQLATFSAFALHDPATFTPVQEPESHAVFTLNERIERVVLWVNQSFLLPQDFYYPGKGALHIVFVAIPSGKPLVIHMDVNGLTIVSTDDINLAAEIISSLSAFLGISDLQVKAEFPTIESELTELASKIGEQRDLGEKLSGDVTEQSDFVKLAVVRLEDSRLLKDPIGLRRAVLDLEAANRTVINQQRLRIETHKQLVANLRRLNNIIQTAASLRVGKYRHELISSCREAIKENKLTHIIKLIRVG